MKNYLYVFYLLVCCFILPLHSEESPFSKEYVDGSNRFAYSLFQKMQENDNICFSPWNISTTCGLAFIGAEGTTKSQMQKTFGYPTNNNEVFCKEQSRTEAFLAPVVDSAQAVAVQQDFALNQSYVSHVKEKLHAELFPIDLTYPNKAASMINQWVQRKTQGHISSLVSGNDFSHYTRLVLLGTCFCKAKWAHPFEKNRTKEAPFFAANHKELLVPMMSQQSIMRVFQDSQVSVVWLGCTHPDSSQAELEGIFILPSKTKEIKTLYSQDNLDVWEKSSSFDLVHFTAPKCTLRKKMELKTLLQQLGMKEAFSKAADFSLIEPAKSLLIEKILHEAFLELDEAGITAGAATAVIMGLTSIHVPEQEPRIVRCDRPFLFLLREKSSGLILFTSYIALPGCFNHLSMLP